MNKKYDKPYKDYSELKKLLEEKYKIKEEIGREEEVLDILKTVSIYDLKNGYKEFLITNENEIEFDELFELYTTDKNIQMILLKYSILVENCFKNHLSHFMGYKFGVDVSQYLDIKNFKIKNNNGNIKISQLLKEIKSNLEKKYYKNPTKHYLENHNHVPPWILLKNITFNDSIKLFKFLSYQDEIIKNYNLECTTEEDVTFFINMLQIVRGFRNQIAHNFKIITYRTNDKLYLKKYQKEINDILLTDLDIKNRKGENDMLAMILSLYFLLNNLRFRAMFIYELLLAFSIKNKNIIEIYEKISGLPKNLKKRLSTLWQLYEKYLEN